MNAPAYTSADYVPYRLAFASLSDKLFTEIRTKRNLSYAPQAFARGGAIPYSAVYVTTTNPKAAVEVMVDQIDSFKTTGFTEKDLKNSKALFITSNYMKDESTNAIAASLGAAETLGNWKIAEELPALINNTTQDQMTSAFRKYITGIKWNYLGIKKQADDASAEFNLPVTQ
jgi:predicted Zn-dependent peptidase